MQITRAQVLGGKLKPLMLLDPNLWAAHYIAQLVTSKTSNITTKGGKSLSREIWRGILRIAIHLANETPPLYIQGFEMQELPMHKILRCREVEPDIFPIFESADEIYNCERFLNQPTEEEIQEYLPSDTYTGTEDNFLDVVITPFDRRLPFNVGALFFELTVPDLIEFLYNGQCRLCGGARYICSDCTGGQAQEFGVFRGCGVDIACPVCMGLEFSLERKRFLDKYYYDGPTLEEEEKEVDDWVRNRMDLFGYEWPSNSRQESREQNQNFRSAVAAQRYW